MVPISIALANHSILPAVKPFLFSTLYAASKSLKDNVLSSDRSHITHLGRLDQNESTKYKARISNGTTTCESKSRLFYLFSISVVLDNAK